jgi:hypothetical protein
MKRFIAALAVMVGFGLAAPVVSQAAVPMGNCWLHVANLDVTGSGSTNYAQGGGWVDQCNINNYYEAYQTVCIQVQTPSGSFVDINSPHNTCNATGWRLAPTYEYFTACDGCGVGSHGYFLLTSGHVYRTANHASLRAPNGSQWWNSYYQSPAYRAP